MSKWESKGSYKRLHNSTVIMVMLLILMVVLVIATAIGAVYVPFFQTVKIILKNLGIGGNFSFPDGQEQIIFYIRFPRVIVAMLVGAALATSGTVLQGMFRNPMADSGIIGVSSGAGLGAVLAITAGLSAVSIYFLPLFASVGAMAAGFLIFLLSVRKGKIPVLTLILSGIAVSTFLGAITNLILTLSYDYQVKEFLFWSVGGLGNRRWEHVSLAFIPIIVCTGILFTYARDLNIMLLGEEEAQAVGMNPSAVRKVLLVLVAVNTAAAVSVAGAISFVGLVVPHILRLIVGSDHKVLLPASAVGGAIFLVVCDLVARLANETGVGIITALVGAPYFLFLLNRARKEEGMV